MTSTYRVRQGDTLSAIARRNHVSVDELARTNNIRDPDRIRTGQRITLPGSTDSYEGAPQRSAANGGVRRAPANPAQAGDTFEPGRTAAANAVAPGASGTRNGYRNIDLHAFRQGGSNSESAIVVGTSEGNRTPNGGFRASYGGHTDPGNAAHNRGSFSYQGRGASTPQQADALWNRELGRVTPRYEQAARQAGLDPNNALLASTFYDLHTQSPRAAQNFVNRELPRLARDPRGITSESLIDARVNAYRNDAGQLRAAGFNHSESRLRSDQTRREGELVRALDARGYREGGAVRPGTTSEARTGSATPTNPNDTERVAPSSDRPTVQARTPWYSQYDGAHVERAGSEACFRAATAMARGAGATVTSVDKRIQVATAEGPNGITVDRQQAARGRDYIDGQLAAGRPVVVGVNHRAGRNVGNKDRITDHFVVVTGRGVDAQGRTYYQFHDPATRNESRGRDTNPNNRFYVNEQTGGLYRPASGAARFAVERRYDVAMIRPNA